MTTASKLHNEQTSKHKKNETNSKKEGSAKDPKCFSPRDKTKNQQETGRFGKLGIRLEGARVIPPVLRGSRSSQGQRRGLGFFLCPSASTSWDLSCAQEKALHSPNTKNLCKKQNQQYNQNSSKDPKLKTECFAKERSWHNKDQNFGFDKSKLQKWANRRFGKPLLPQR